MGGREEGCVHWILHINILLKGEEGCVHWILHINILLKMGCGPHQRL